ncbi:hypothetical protein LguiA_026706 [Lonicera macranthoides]
MWPKVFKLVIISLLCVQTGGPNRYPGPSRMHVPMSTTLLNVIVDEQLVYIEAKGRFFRGSTHCWVVLAAGEDIYAGSPDICLINPLSRVQIQLPPRYKFPDVQSYSVDKVEEEYHLVGGDSFFENLLPSNYIHLDLLHKLITSYVPSNVDCVVVAIIGEYGQVARCMCNCKNWRPIARVRCKRFV